MLERTTKQALRLQAVSRFTQSQRYASKPKRSMKEQFEVPSSEELVKKNEEMRKALGQGRTITASKPVTAGKMFGLALLAGIGYGLFERYSLSSLQSEPERAKVMMMPDQSEREEELTVIRRRRGSSYS